MKSIRLQILDREYALRVTPEREAEMREIARNLDARMQAFMEAHPEQARLTTAVVTALALAEENHTLREAVSEGNAGSADEPEATAETLDALSDELAGLLPSVDAAHEEAVTA